MHVDAGRRDCGLRGQINARKKRAEKGRKTGKVMGGRGEEAV